MAELVEVLGVIAAREERPVGRGERLHQVLDTHPVQHVIGVLLEVLVLAYEIVLDGARVAHFVNGQPVLVPLLEGAAAGLRDEADEFGEGRVVTPRRGPLASGKRGGGFSLITNTHIKDNYNNNIDNDDNSNNNG